MTKLAAAGLRAATAGCCSFRKKGCEPPSGVFGGSANCATIAALPDALQRVA